VYRIAFTLEAGGQGFTQRSFVFNQKDAHADLLSGLYGCRGNGAIVRSVPVGRQDEYAPCRATRSDCSAAIFARRPTVRITSARGAVLRLRLIARRRRCGVAWLVPHHPDATFRGVDLDPVDLATALVAALGRQHASTGFPFHASYRGRQ